MELSKKLHQLEINCILQEKSEIEKLLTEKGTFVLCSQLSIQDGAIHKLALGLCSGDFSSALLETNGVSDVFFKLTESQDDFKGLPTKFFL